MLQTEEEIIVFIKIQVDSADDGCIQVGVGGIKRMTYCPPLYSYGNAHQTKRPISHSGVPGQYIIITIAKQHHTHSVNNNNC